MKLSKSTVFDCSIIDLGKVENRAGNITVVENNGIGPFKVKRIYFLYDVPGGESRGGHAHYELEQYIIAASGSFVVIVDDGVNKRSFYLNRPNMALHIVPGLWRELDGFSAGSICMVLASQEYLETDYIRDYKKFITIK